MRCGIIGIAAIAISAGSAAAQAPAPEELRQLTIEELSNIQITSVSKRAEPISTAAASIYVITNEDIRRSGAKTIPEVLRLAPNLHVARLDSYQYAISARGFNTFEASNKLLVLIDGRSVYTPLHAGVFWDQQQVMVEDIDQIEVISGPGGTLWGANAVNGVINILTKSARETKGGLVSAQVGTVDDRLAGRYGGKLGHEGGWRIYGIGNELGNTKRYDLTRDGSNADNDFSARQAGFRFDWDEFTIQGDLFENDYDILDASTQGKNSGRNLLARWIHKPSATSSIEIQGYYDWVERTVPFIKDTIETFDIEVEHSSKWEDHTIVWGGGYRVSEDRLVNDQGTTVLDPVDETFKTANLFVQDTIALNTEWSFTAGLKMEHNSRSGFEWMPSVRLGWAVNNDHFIWAAISRVVRIPSRVDRDLEAPGLFEPPGDRFKAEKLVAYELGWRGQPTANTSLSATAYLHQYDDLRALVAGETLPYSFGNAMEGKTYGFEGWGDYRVDDWWSLSGGINLLKKDLDLKPNGIPLVLDQHAGNDPEYQFMLRSEMNLTDTIEVDVGVRYVDNLSNPDVPSYVAVDARLGWHVTDDIELSLKGFNIFDKQHVETGQPTGRWAIRQSFYAGVQWKF